MHVPLSSQRQPREERSDRSRLASRGRGGVSVGVNTSGDASGGGGVGQSGGGDDPSSDTSSGVAKQSGASDLVAFTSSMAVHQMASSLEAMSPPSPLLGNGVGGQASGSDGHAGSAEDALEGFGKEVEAFTDALRERFESEVLVTARAGLRAVSERVARERNTRLEEQRCESERETRRLEEQAAHLQAEVARLNTVNTALAAKVDVFADRLSDLQLRNTRGSTASRCLQAWGMCAAQSRKERVKTKVAEDHSRRVMLSRVMTAWRREARRRLNSRGMRAADMKLEAITKEIIGRYEAELSSMRAALDDANRQIGVEKGRQRDMEEGMRRTLRRGISAMNMEAMQILHDAREADEESIMRGVPLGGADGVSDSLHGYNQSRTATSFSARPVTPRQRISEECPLPLAPPRPTVPSSR